eukprot:909305-Rhodomonas_salina.1
MRRGGISTAITANRDVPEEVRKLQSGVQLLIEVFRCDSVMVTVGGCVGFRVTSHTPYDAPEVECFRKGGVCASFERRGAGSRGCH